MASTLNLDTPFITRLLEALTTPGKRYSVPLGWAGTLQPDLSEIKIRSGRISINFLYRYRRTLARPLKLTAEFAIEDLDGGVIWLRITKFGLFKGKILNRGIKLWPVAKESKGSIVSSRNGLIGLPLTLIYAAWPTADPPDIVDIKITDRLEIRIA